MVKNLVDVLDEFKNKKILVIGDIMLDKSRIGNSTKVSPEAPTLVVNSTEENYTLGGAGNVANNVISLGAKCCLYGVIGKDFEGEKINKMCKEGNLILKEYYNDKPTIVKERIIVDRHQVFRIDREERDIEKIEKNLQNEILNSLNGEAEKFDFIILSDYDKFLFTKGFSYNLINMANSKNKKVLVDPKPKNIDFYRGSTIICPNIKEAVEITKIRYKNNEKEKSLNEICSNLNEKTNSTYIVITCGEDGAFLYHKNNDKPKLIPTRAREVIDVTGAGDTFAATLALCMSCKIDVSDAVEIANYASGIVCGKAGTATVTADEIKEYILKEEK